MKCRGRFFALAVIAAGAVIIMSIVLPSCVWWVLLGVALIIAGLAMLRFR